MEKLNIMYLDYDYENDILFFFQKNNKDYEFSDALNESIIIDYNKDRQPMGLEIFNASKLFKSTKPPMKTIVGGKLNLEIIESKIKLSISLISSIHHNKTSLPSQNIIGENILNLPNTETKVEISA